MTKRASSALSSGGSDPISSSLESSSNKMTKVSSKKKIQGNPKKNANIDDVEGQQPQPPKDWDRCHVYMTQKHRFCRGRPVTPSGKYCGNHMHLEEQPDGETVQGQQQELGTATASSNTNTNTTTITPRKRIPCPIDPSHYIFEDSVEKHIQICPKVKRQRVQENQNYYSKDINLGGYGTLWKDDENTDSSSSNNQAMNLEWAQNIALRVLQVHQRIFTDENVTSNEKLSLLTFDDIHNSVRLEDLSQPELDAGMVEKGFAKYRIKAGGPRHVPQLASLVGHLRAINALPSNMCHPCGIGDHVSNESNNNNDTKRPLILLEMGAGRGMFGLTAVGIARAQEMNAHLVMVERAGTRGKAEKIFRNAVEAKAVPEAEIATTSTTKTTTVSTTTQKSYLKMDNIQWSRLVCDLSHVNLPVVVNEDRFRNGKIVVLAKHLCGAGMDIALKSLEPIKDKIDGCVLATCCHGICDWNHYVGRDYLRDEMEGGKDEDEREKLSFGATEFDLLRRWCAGTVANRFSKSNNKHENGEEAINNDDNDDDDAEHAIANEEEESRDLQQQTGRNGKIVPISAVVESLNLACGIPGLGRACQRLIDYGRSEYMRKILFAGNESSCVKLQHYVSYDVTPQNAVLIADTTTL